MNSWRKFENVHILLWLLKDICWCLTWKNMGMFMILPTIFMAIYITWLSRKLWAELIHNWAVLCWITANGCWMTGEFYGMEEMFKPIALVFFGIGISILTIFYIEKIFKRMLY